MNKRILAGCTCGKCTAFRSPEQLCDAVRHRADRHNRQLSWSALEVLQIHVEWKRNTTVQMIESLGLTDNLEAIGMSQDIDDLRRHSESDHLMHGTVHIFFALLHVTAIRVELDPEDEGYQYHRAVDARWQEEVGHIYELAGGEGNLQTTEIPGIKGEWLIFCHPYKA